MRFLISSEARPPDVGAISVGKSPPSGRWPHLALAKTAFCGSNKKIIEKGPKRRKRRREGHFVMSHSFFPNSFSKGFVVKKQNGVEVFTHHLKIFTLPVFVIQQRNTAPSLSGRKNKLIKHPFLGLVWKDLKEALYLGTSQEVCGK